MEKKNKDQKLGSACNQESQTNEPQNKQDEARPNVTLSSPSHDSVPSSNQQQQPSIVQWPYTPQNATEQFFAINQWQQLPHPQQGQVFPHSTLPFWQPQLPVAGGPFLGANVPSIFQTFNDNGWQAHPAVPGGTSSTSQTLVPNMCHHVGYTFPGFPGPWDPSSCLAQMHQLQHPYVGNFPGALGFSSATPWMPGCLVSGEHSLQRGIIRPQAKLSQKHQRLWEAQSEENVQLRSLINKLQAEVSDYKDQLTKLEEEVSSLKRKVEEPTNEVLGSIPVGTGQVGQPSKRGRPKRSSSSVGALLQESQPRARGRKPALMKPQFELKSPIFEKVILKKVESKELAKHSTATMAQQREINEKILNAVTDVSGNIQVNQSNSTVSAYQGQVHQEYQGGPTLRSTSGVKANFEKDKDLKPSYGELSQPDKVLNNSMGVSAKYIGNTGNGNLGWTVGIPSQDCARGVLDVAHQSFFHNGSFTQQGGNMTPGWNFANEEDASQELEETIVGSNKDENEEEMGDDTSFAAEEIGVTKDVVGCTMNNAKSTISKGLSPLHNW